MVRTTKSISNSLKCLMKYNNKRNKQQKKNLLIKSSIGKSTDVKHYNKWKLTQPGQNF